VLGIAVPTWTEGITEEVFFVIIMSVVIFVIGYTRNRDLDHIQEQADLLVATEWQMVQLLLENEKVRILSEFIRNVSHDFRTPLSIIATKAYLINKSKSLEEQQRNMESINHQIGRLTQLIDGMLAMSKLDSDLGIEIETVNIEAVLKEIVYRLNDMAGEKQIKLQLNLPETLPPLHANTKWLEDALSEVIKNGIMYTPAGGEVVINGSSDAQMIIIEICDTGIGIPEEDTDHIFERLFRGDKTRASTGGVGLGLSIAKRVVELHEGEISVESTVGKGSVFRITLPLSSDPIAKRLMSTS
jgi:two-component system phosphate regulon sensor histidine kinase PhoR